MTLHFAANNLNNDLSNHSNSSTAATISGRWKRVAALIPVLLVISGCSHLPNKHAKHKNTALTTPSVSKQTTTPDTASINQTINDNQLTTTSQNTRPQLKLTPQLPVITVIDPLLAGLQAEDIAKAKKQAQQNYQSSWKAIRKRSRYVRERLLNSLDHLQAPRSLQVIPIVESTYNPYALSHAGALGLWQLMPRTARGLGVISGKKTDGRRHIDTSTTAAIRYLQQLHWRFDNWPLAIAAYNMGPYAVARRIKKQPWENSHGLENMPIPASTRAYVQHVIGLAALLNDQTFSLPEPEQTHELQLQPPVDIHRLAHISGMAKHDIFRFNPSLNQAQYMNHAISIHVPASHYELMQSKLNLAGPKFVHKTVKAGDSLWSIAKKHHTSIDALKHQNRDLGKYLRIGQRLKIPANRLPQARGMENPLLTTSRRIRYKIRSGDSLWRIANRFGTTPKAIARSNQISMNSMIRVGDTIWVFAKVRPS